MIMKTHKLLWNIALFISVAVQWNDFKTIFALLSNFLDFQYTNIFLEKLWQPWKFLDFSATSALVSYKLICYKKSVTVVLKRC